MQASKSKPTTAATRKPFGPLSLYKNRVFLSANETVETELISELKALYQLDSLEVEVVTLTRGDKSKEFRFVEVPGHPRIYLIQLVNHSIGIRRVTDVYELAVYDGGATAIVYVHDTAITLFKLATLHNFPCVLFHDDDEFRSYLKSKFYGDDSKEINFILAQQQEYIRTGIKFREDFAEHKKEVKEQRNQRRPAREHQKPSSKPMDKRESDSPKKQTSRKPAPKNEGKKAQKGQNNSKPKKETSPKTPQAKGWEEVKTGRDKEQKTTEAKSRDVTPEPVQIAAAEVKPRPQNGRLPVGGYAEAAARPPSREGRREDGKPIDRPQWSLPVDAAPSNNSVPQAANSIIAQSPIGHGASLFGVASAYPPWMQPPAAAPQNSSPQITPEMIAMMQAVFAQQQAGK